MDGNARQKMMQANAAARCGWAEEKYEVDYGGRARGKSMEWILVGMRGGNPVENKFIDIFILMESKKYVRILAIFRKISAGL